MPIVNDLHSERTDFDWLSNLEPLLQAQVAWHDGSYDRPVWLQVDYGLPAPFLLSCGAGLLADLARRFRFTPERIRSLGSRTDSVGRPIFTESFLNYLQRLRIRADVWAALEGALLLPGEPLALVRGPKAHVLLLSSPLRRLLWYSTHWATLAAQLRRLQLPLVEEDTPPAPPTADNPAGWATRAAYIGGAEPAQIAELLRAPKALEEEPLRPISTYGPPCRPAKPLVQIRRTYIGSIPQGDIWLTRAGEEQAGVGKTSAHIWEVRSGQRRCLHYERFQNLYQPVLLRGYPIFTDVKPPYLRQRTLRQLQIFSAEILEQYPWGWFAEGLAP